MSCSKIIDFHATTLLTPQAAGNYTHSDSITAAGGLNNWQPDDMADEQSLKDIWLQRKKHSTSTTDFPGLYLGYEAIDKFRQAHTLFAGTLPDDHVFTIAGGHNWS